MFQLIFLPAFVLPDFNIGTALFTTAFAAYISPYRQPPLQPKPPPKPKRNSQSVQAELGVFSYAFSWGSRAVKKEERRKEKEKRSNLFTILNETRNIMEMEIELKLIRIDGGTQPREKLDMFVVDDYAQAMQEGVQFPPLTVFYDGQNYWLADGYHRYHATRQLGLSHAKVEVRQGTRREAVLYSCGANASHGMRRTNQDKRRAVLTLLGDNEWQRWSDREIARRCVVTHTFIANLRRESQPPEVEIFTLSSLGGADLATETATAFLQEQQEVLLGTPALPEYESMATVAIDSYSGNSIVTEANREIKFKPVESNSSSSELQPVERAELNLATNLSQLKSPLNERLYINRHGTLSTRHVPVQSVAPPPVPLSSQTQPTSALALQGDSSEIKGVPTDRSFANLVSKKVIQAGSVGGSLVSDEPSLSAQLRARLADTPVREQPGELARLAKLNPTDQTRVVGLLAQSYQTASSKPLTVQQALSQHRHEQAEASRQALLTSDFTQSTDSANSSGSSRGDELTSETELWTVTAEQGVVACEMVLADPPYGILKGVEWEPQEVSHLEGFSREWATRWGEQSGAGVIAIFWSEDYLFEGRHWFDESLPDYEFQQLLIWHYPNTLKPIGRGHFRNSFDPIFIYRRKGATPPTVSTNWPAGVTQSDCHVGAIPQSNYLEVDRKFHPAQKPLSVALWLLSILSQPGDRVADPFCGSGTFGVAAVQLGRVYHGIETNEEYQKLARHRITTYGLTEALTRKPQNPSQVRFEAI